MNSPPGAISSCSSSLHFLRAEEGIDGAHGGRALGAFERIVPGPSLKPMSPASVLPWKCLPLICWISVLASSVHGAEELIPRFARAVEAGDLATVEAMLEDGLDPNIRIPGDALQHTPLFVAVEENHLPIAKALLAAGADPRIEDENGDPVMVNAADHRTTHFWEIRGAQLRQTRIHP